jgi:hypothetical protein
MTFFYQANLKISSKYQKSESALFFSLLAHFSDFHPYTFANDIKSLFARGKPIGDMWFF